MIRLGQADVLLLLLLIVSPTSGPQYPGITLYNGSEICFRANHYGQILITYYTSGLSKVNDVYNGQVCAVVKFT